MITTLPQSLIEAAKQHLLENKVDDLKAQNPHISHEIDLYSSIDKTTTKKFLPWLVSQHKKGNVTPHDPSITQTIEGFEKYKNKHGVKDHSGLSYQDLKSAVEPHIGSASTKKEQTQKENDEGVLEIPSTKIYHIKTKKAAQNIYGGGHELGGNHTNWCVSARGDENMFGHYGDLYTIHVPDDPKSPYAYHPFEDHVTDRHNDPDDKNSMHEMPSNEAVKINPALHDSISRIKNLTNNDANVYKANKEKVQDDTTSSKELSDIYHYAHKNNYTTLINHITEHPNTSADILHHAATTLPDEFERTSNISSHNNLSDHTINKMLDHPEESVRFSYITHPNASKETLIKALGDNSRDVVRSALRHDNLPYEDAMSYFNINSEKMSPNTQDVFRKQLAI